MKILSKKTAIALIIVCFGAALDSARDSRPQREDEPAEVSRPTDPAKKTGILVSPLTFYLPETRWAFGLAGNFVFRVGKSRPGDRPSTVSPLFIYTQNKQFRALLAGDFYFAGGYHLTTEIKYQKYPDKFFGIGSLAPEENKEDFTPNTFAFSASLLKKIKNHLHVGFRYDYAKVDIAATEPGKRLAAGDIPGSRGSRVSGLGLLLDYDSRDNIFFPGRGWWLKLSATFYDKFLGSRFQYRDYQLDLRRYITLFPGHVLALRSLVRSQDGTVPFLRLAGIGGQYLLRGYYQGRYRDRNMITMQAEYRLPLFWRLRAVAFAGVGDVSHRLGDFNFDHPKTVYGFGLRYRFNTRENMYVRFDIGFGKDTSGFYFSVFEVF